MNKPEAIHKGGVVPFFALAGLYVVFFACLRLWLSPAIGTDDVEQAVFAQSWAFGYNPSQPPLFTWIIFSFMKLFGVGAYDFVLVRYGLLFLTLLFSWLCARRLVASPPLVLLAAFSPLLLYNVGWGAHQGFTHTAMLCVLLFATTYAFLRLLERGSLAAYAVFGLTIGLGLNSKFGFALFIVALLLAATLVPAPRARIVNGRIFISLAIAALLVAQPAWWMLSGFGSYADVFSRNMGMAAPEGYFARVGTGLWKLSVSSIAFLSPFWLFALLIFPGALTKRDAPPPAGVWDTTLSGGRVLGLYFLIAFCLAILGVLFFGVTFFKARWMHPFWLLFPLYFFHHLSLLGGEANITPGRIRGFGRALVIVPLMAAVFWVAQGVSGPPLCKKCRLYEPYPQLAEKIAQAGFSGGTILSQDEHIGGNLRLKFTSSRIVNMVYGYYVPPVKDAADGQCLLVWRAPDKAPDNALAQPLVPPSMASFALKNLGVTLLSDKGASIAEEENTANGRVLRLGYLFFEGQGSCR